MGHPRTAEPLLFRLEIQQYLITLIIHQRSPFPKRLGVRREPSKKMHRHRLDSLIPLHPGANSVRHHLQFAGKLMT